MEMQPYTLKNPAQTGSDLVGTNRPEERENLTRSEKYLLAAALVMGALLILYNALSGVPLASPEVVRTAAVQTLSSNPSNAAAAGNEPDNAVEPAASQPAQAVSGSAKDGKLQPGETIDLNAATVEELMRLPGVGQKTADAIYRLRQEIGAYRSAGDLIYVDGIGQKTVEKLAPYLRVEE
ncbi:MAG: hypothetical protein HFE86_07265 [Clostridiales bacterium]|nr:hypothetical protein [Clostridiales bacterium]